jgi:hypothetical protein
LNWVSGGADAGGAGAGRVGRGGCGGGRVVVIVVGVH